MEPSEVNEAIFFRVVTCCISLHVCIQECLIWALGVFLWAAIMYRFKKNLNPFGSVSVKHTGNFEVPMQRLQGFPLGIFTISKVLFRRTLISCRLPVNWVFRHQPKAAVIKMLQGSWAVGDKAFLCYGHRFKSSKGKSAAF